MAKTTWVLVADGGRAHVYLLAEDKKSVKTIIDFDNKGGRSTPAAIGEGELAVGHIGKGSEAVAANHESDPKRHSAQGFVRELAALLSAHAADYDELIVVAPPQALGDLRKDFDKLIEAKIVLELAKDLTHVSAHDLPEHLEKAMKVAP